MFLTYSLKGGGTERMVSYLANGFAKLGYHVEIGLFDISEPAYEIDPIVTIVDFGVSENNRLRRIFAHIKKIKKHLMNNSINVLFAFMVSMIPFAVLSKNKNVKIIGAERTNPKNVRKVYKACIKIFAPFCDGFIFQTKGAKECYPKKVQKHSAVIGNMVPEVQMSKEKKKPMTVCAVGRLHSDKDFDTLIRAFELVVRKYPQAKLYIFGDGPLKNNLKRLAHRLSILSNIVWKGFSKDVLEEIQQYEVFAFSSKAEGMPNALLEAMAVGMPCVSSDCEYGPSDIIKNGENGFLTPVGDYKLMGQKIIDLLENKDLREKFFTSAIRTMKEYSEDNIIEKYVVYVDKILSQS